ncbi:hypothetical protein GWK47_006887 [Chionoecetes opilio]|uniref:Uncharacterized protein n=1 Tax=Chionoecetes opilio TaxID=41210 RepID=A0A8J4YAK0_CHIOP|nr:hypothetical protein GWK47_006887 [Chionoecetes opilio]
MYPWAPFVIFGTGALLAGAGTFLLPETRGQGLPDTVANLEARQTKPAIELSSYWEILRDLASCHPSALTAIDTRHSASTGAGCLRSERTHIAEVIWPTPVLVPSLMLRPLWYSPMFTPCLRKTGPPPALHTHQGSTSATAAATPGLPHPYPVTPASTSHQAPHDHASALAIQPHRASPGHGGKVGHHSRFPMVIFFSGKPSSRRRGRSRGARTAFMMSLRWVFHVSLGALRHLRTGALLAGAGTSAAGDSRPRAAPTLWPQTGGATDEAGVTSARGVIWRVTGGGKAVRLPDYNTRHTSPPPHLPPVRCPPPYSPVAVL